MGGAFYWNREYDNVSPNEPLPKEAWLEPSGQHLEIASSWISVPRRIEEVIHVVLWCGKDWLYGYVSSNALRYKGIELPWYIESSPFVKRNHGSLPSQRAIKTEFHDANHISAHHSKTNFGTTYQTQAISYMKPKQRLQQRPTLTSIASNNRGSHVEEESQRRASEPALHTRISPYSDEYNGTPQASCHQSTSGSFFGVGRPNKGKGAIEDDPLGLTWIQDADVPIVDLVFIRRLSSSSKKAWSYNRDIANFWPPWLGHEVGFRGTRIFTFGYNSKFAAASTTLNTVDFAKDLLFQTKNYQHPFKEEGPIIGNRPMIFVVHSMGGLVVKKAFIIGRTDDHYKDMISKTYGIVFLGTPHRGSNLAQSLNNILKATAGGPKIYVSELEKGSTSLQDIKAI